MKKTYAVGQEVMHTSKNKLAIIVRPVDGSEEKRYIIKHSRFSWSVPEKYLKPVKGAVK